MVLLAKMVPQSDKTRQKNVSGAVESMECWTHCLFEALRPARAAKDPGIVRNILLLSSQLVIESQ
jgi:hypothetical protein